MKKRLLGLILLISVLTYTNVLAASNPYKQTTQWGTNCTWYAWKMAYEKAGVTLPGWGNANTWYNSAKKAGYEVGQTPKAKSIVVWEWDKYGHVGYVEKVSGDKIYVWDSDSYCIDEDYEPYKNCMDSGAPQQACYDSYAVRAACEYSASYWSTPGDLIGYIYLSSAPKTTTTTTKKTTTTTMSTSTTTTTTVLSSNANLSELTISVGEIDFDKDITSYDVTVSSEVTSITVDANQEDGYSVVDGDGRYELIVGLNVIDINVMALDGTQKTYTLNVRRESEEVTTTKVGNVNENKKQNKFKLIYLIYIGISLVTLILLIIIIKKFKRH